MASYFIHDGVSEIAHYWLSFKQKPPVHKALNIYRIVVLLASAGAELAAGYLMSFRPETFFTNPGEQLISLAGSFAVGATTIGIYSVMLLFLREKQTQLAGFAVLALYHAGIGITQTICGSAGIEATIFHGWLTVSVIGLAIYRGRQSA